MESFSSDDMTAWRKNFRINSRMKSANRKLLALYDIILKNEKTDSDYWYFVGADEFINSFAALDAHDIKELAADLPNWTDDQKWILGDCLVYGGVRHDGYQDSPSFVHQSYLLTFLFSQTDDEDLKSTIFESADLIFAGQPKPYHLLMPIKIWADDLLKNPQQSFYRPNSVHYQLIEAAIEKAIR